ncbi:NAD(P)-binding protein [Hyaloscypha hepaticicola]|uniref:NAD(P)-binding protein n=1 Tax=Hyaloscypha hepaticicola TaxID=2082293 RepID=A0A2J6PD87_9HELO|nr:NAD(P)-binding protein [Hyaloscypha hepaticicola]
MATQKYNKLAGKHVLVIGGTSGIGYSVAEACLESSASVTISSSSPDRVSSCVASLKASYPHSNTPKVSGHVCDLSQPTVEKDIEKLFEACGQVDHIVFTAGDKLATIPLQDATYENIIRAGQVRFIAPLLVAKIGSRYLKNKTAESSIIFTTGSVAEKPVPGWSVVASFASGMHGMVRNLAIDLKPVRVNVVSPGAVDTQMWNGMPEEAKKGMFKEIAGKVPTGHVGRPEEVAEAYLWLMKDSNVTGFVACSDSGSKLV